MSFDPQACARFFLKAHDARQAYEDPPADFGPATLDEAYAAQGALHALLLERRGPIGGWKIATTTKVMQRLVGIDHPCFGAVFASTIAASASPIPLSRFVSLKIECEIALRLGAALPPRTDWTAETVAPVVAGAMPAFELVEDRNADYSKLRAFGLIADNCWNAGVVLGPERPFGRREGVIGVEGRHLVDGALVVEGASDDPAAALADVANHCGRLGITMAAGAIVMTGSLVATQKLTAGQRLRFEVDGLGAVEATAV